MDSRRDAAAAVVAAAAVFLFFLPTVAYPFLNWDDGEIFVRNAALHAPGFLRWALTTTYLEHFQPGAWLVWGAVDRVWTLTPGAAHAINVVLHAACAALIVLLGERFELSRFGSVLAALLFALHPLRVEVVAWASAMPYSLALLFALISALALVQRRSVAAVVFYALSLAARPIALGFPVVVWAVEWWADRSAPGPKGPGLQRYAAQRRAGSFGPARFSRIAPFIVLAIAAAILESRARLTSTFGEVGVGARLTMACSAPFKYLWRTIVPVGLTPLDPLALAPRADLLVVIASAIALVVITWAAWRWRETNPGSLVAWVSYLALLVPAVGLVPSGLQATADRYAYLPAVPLSLWIVAAVHSAARGPAEAGRRMRRSDMVSGVSPTVVVSVVILAMAILSYRQMQYWRDSIALWTRAVDVDPRSDVARYNLASALADSGRRDDAVAAYDEVLRIVPEHRDAEKNRNLLRAARLEDEANRLASTGRLDAAIAQYRAAIALDPARTHSQASLGMALVQTGRTADAIEPLRAAIRLGSAEPAVANALAFSLKTNGRTRDACDVLETAHARFPDDRDVAANLAQLGSECGRGK